MKNKILLVTVTSLLILVGGITFISINRYKKHTESIVRQSIIYSQKNEYLMRCIKYQSLFTNKKLDKVDDSKFVLYYTGKSCSACVESLLLMLNKNYGLENNLIILIDDIIKEEFILNLMDGFNLNYKYSLELKKTLKPINDVLLFKMNNGIISNVLEYRPEEEFLFKEYFKHYNFMSVNK